MSVNFKHPTPDESYQRMVDTVRETNERGNDQPEELFFDPESGRLVVSRGAPETNHKSAVAAGTLAREGFFGPSS